MELTQLKYFLCAAKNQHITKSAEMLHIAQPALTKSIKSLEEELGVPLFAKSGRNIVLTQCGRYFEERLEPLIASLDSLPHEVRRMAEREGETVRICVQSASMPVTEAVVNFRREHPSVNFQITREMTDGLYDIIVTTKMPSSPLPAGKSEVIDEEIFLAVPALPEFRGRDSIELAELRDRGFVSLIGSRYLRVICDRFCHTAGFEPDVIRERQPGCGEKHDRGGTRRRILAGVLMGASPGGRDQTAALVLPGVPQRACHSHQPVGN